MELNEKKRETLKAFINVVLPPDAVRSDELERRVFDHVSESLRFLPPSAWTPFGLGFLAFEYLAIVMGPSPKPFCSHDRRGRRLYVKRWAHSSFSLFRDFMKGLKGLVMLAYYEQPEVMALLNYDPQTYVDELKAKDGNQRQ